MLSQKCPPHTIALQVHEASLPSMNLEIGCKAPSHALRCFSSWPLHRIRLRTQPCSGMPTSAHQPFHPFSRRVTVGSFMALLAALFLLCSGGSSALAQAGSTIRVRLADGFDFPVGKPDAVGFYKARGYWPNGHLGEDWNGDGGGDSDLGDPIYATGRGVVILSQNIGVGWGNCILIGMCFARRTVALAWWTLFTVICTSGK